MLVIIQYYNLQEALHVILMLLTSCFLYRWYYAKTIPFSRYSEFIRWMAQASISAVRVFLNLVQDFHEAILQFTRLFVSGSLPPRFRQLHTPNTATRQAPLTESFPLLNCHIHREHIARDCIHADVERKSIGNCIHSPGKSGPRLQFFIVRSYYAKLYVVRVLPMDCKTESTLMCLSC